MLEIFLWIVFVGLGALVLYDLIKNGFSLVAFFKDADGKPSMMRFMSFMSFWLFVYVTIRMVNDPAILNIELVLIIGMLAFAPKAFQTFAEKFKKG